jgi:hypothetical protein
MRLIARKGKFVCALLSVILSARHGEHRNGRAICGLMSGTRETHKSIDATLPRRPF